MVSDGSFDVVDVCELWRGPLVLLCYDIRVELVLALRAIQGCLLQASGHRTPSHLLQLPHLQGVNFGWGVQRALIGLRVAQNLVDSWNLLKALHFFVVLQGLVEVTPLVLLAIVPEHHLVIVRTLAPVVKLTQHRSRVVIH